MVTGAWSLLSTTASNYPDPNFLTSISTIIPAKRLGTVSEISSAVCFLFSPGASYITGHNMYARVL